MARRRAVVGVDVGNTKVCTIIGEASPDGGLNILGFGSAPSRGLRKGVVVNIEETVSALTTSIERAERISGFQIHNVVLGVSGTHIASQNSRGIIAIPRDDQDISEDDVSRALEAARSVPLSSDRQLLHVIPRSFVVDGQNGVKYPVGMSGHRLEVDVHIVSGTTASVQHLRRCVERAGIEVETLVLNVLAAAEAVITEEDKEQGIALADVGGGTTNVAVFKEGAVAHTGVIPLGGENVTKDIAIVMRIPNLTAEHIKIASGCALSADIDPDQYIDLPPGEEDRDEPLFRRELCEIIEARTEEMLAAIEAEIEKAHVEGGLPGGLVLTGGTALLPGLREQAQDLLGVPVRIGVPSHLSGLTDTVSSPAYAAAVGLLRWGLHQGFAANEFSERQLAAAGERLPGSSSGGMGGRLMKWLREFLP